MFKDQVVYYFSSLVNSFSFNSTTLPLAFPVATAIYSSADANTATQLANYASWPLVPLYLVFLLVMNNLNPLLGKHHFTGTLVQYFLQGVPLMLGLTGLSPRAALYQLSLYLFSGYMPNIYTKNVYFSF